MSAGQLAVIAAPCAKCGAPAVVVQGRQWLCQKHYRLGQMRANAKRRGKSVPSLAEIEALIPPNMQCRHCLRIMPWLGRYDRSAVASLQHYRDGSLGIICRSCNTRHASMPGDTFNDLPLRHKMCPACRTIQPDAAFCRDAHKAGVLQRRPICRACSTIAHGLWAAKNREHLRLYNRERALRQTRAAQETV